MILDPNTGGSRLTVSEQLTRSTEGDARQLLPENPERLHGSGILGYEGISSGKHSWDVKVGALWAVGVATKNKSPINERVWGIYLYGYLYAVCELTPECDGSIVSKDSTSFPTEFRVQLDYNQGLLSFFDLNRKTLVHSIKHTFTETVFPYFREDAKIFPAEYRL